MSNPLLVGVDVHRKTNTVCLMDRQGEETSPRFTVGNSHPGTQAFVHQVAQQVVAGDFDAIKIAAEATGWYWWHFLQTPDRDPLLNQWPLELCPFNPRLTVEYSLPVQGTARLEILDLRGHLVLVLFDAHLPAGTDRIEWNGLDDQGRAAASGVYLVRLVTDQGSTRKQVTLLR